MDSIENSLDQSVNSANDTRFQTGMGPVTDRIINGIFDKLTTDNFKEKLTDKIVDPITAIINEKIQPYVYMSIGLYSIVIILLLIIIYYVAVRKY